MKPQTVHLGYEVDTGNPVEVPIAHMCVTGQTQLSGKTTTLAALVLRSGVTAIAFATKRGESAFGLSQTEFEKKEVWTQPFFRHKAGWQHVSDILGAVLSEKLKFERSWIMKVSRGAKTLNDVHQNVKNWLTKPKLRSLDESVLTTIDEYFELFMPELVKLPYSNELLLEEGALNVMDLTSYSTPLQMLVIASVFDEVYKHRNNVAVIVPEAWEFVPNNKNSPVKSAAVTLVRKGGVLKNFIWLDSQDLASVDTEIRRACSVWILGVQREQNEVKRLLSHIPGGTKKPKVEDVMQLQKGQFYVCFGSQIHKTYVQPAWMSNERAYGIAMGELPMMETPNTDHLPHSFNDPATVTVCRPKNMSEETREAITEMATKAAEHVKNQWLITFDPDVEPGKVINVGDGRGWLGSDVAGAFAVKEGGPIISHEQERLGSSLAYGDPIKFLDQRDYARPPAGVEVIIDDGVGKTTFIQPGETDVDDQDRQQYEHVINLLQAQIIGLKQRLGEPLKDSELLFLNEHHSKPDAKADINVPFTSEEASRGPCVAPPSQEPGAVGLSKYSTRNHVANMLNDPWCVEQLRALIPTNGVIKVEPREVVLREFQTAEVERILSVISDASPWQKSVVRYLHAKGSNANYAQLVRAIKGKEQNNLSGQQNKEMKTELKIIVAIGIVRTDSAGRYYPNLEEIVKTRLAQFNATDKDVEDVIGQVLLRVK